MMAEEKFDSEDKTAIANKVSKDRLWVNSVDRLSRIGIGSLGKAFNIEASLITID